MIEKLKKEKAIKANEAVPQLDLILLNSSRLLRLVNQVLDLSKLESGGLKKRFQKKKFLASLKWSSGISRCCLFKSEFH